MYDIAIDKNIDKKKVFIPLFGSYISCSFTSPADDFIEKKLSLDEHLIKHPAASFFVRASGNCMYPTIKDGDLLVIDRALEAKSNSIILAVIDGEFTVKRLILPNIHNECPRLCPDNDLYKEILITPEKDFSVWGVVTYVIHKTFPSEAQGPKIEGPKIEGTI